MSGIPACTSERRRAKLSGPRPATCIVTINKSEGATALVIDGVVPRGPPDGNYELALKGESTSRWKRDRDGWTRLS